MAKGVMEVDRDSSFQPVMPETTGRSVFKCSAGHVTQSGELQVSVPVRTRRVVYHNQATNNKGLTAYFDSKGWEIVEVRPYCFEHAATAPPPRQEPRVDRQFGFETGQPIKNFLD